MLARKINKRKDEASAVFPLILSPFICAMILSSFLVVDSVRDAGFAYGGIFSVFALVTLVAIIFGLSYTLQIIIVIPATLILKKIYGPNLFLLVLICLLLGFSIGIYLTHESYINNPAWSVDAGLAVGAYCATMAVLSWMLTQLNKYIRRLRNSKKLSQN